MMNFTNSLLLVLRTRRIACGALACVPLIVFGWFQWSGIEPPADSGAVQEPARITGSRPRPSADANGDDLGSCDSGKIVLASATDAEAATNGAWNAPDESQDSESRVLAMVAGEWEDDYQGKRHLTVADDGTGKMVVDLDGIGKKLFAPRLSFDIEWSAADGYVTMTTLGGEPKSKVQLVLKLYGSEARYKILELTADRMLLLDADGKTRYDWRRPAAAGESK